MGTEKLIRNLSEEVLSNFERAVQSILSQEEGAKRNWDELQHKNSNG